ncbi:uncharacterized membrane protein (DUF2068 family) [Amycolatopsis bartoniae]|uniref:DUF2127 domain-containing protein n=1 Tax=Amycolatopsis bartoniae TaxID=941986 RepID=A0A8H9ITZ0_9PSEU|nr:DUF2127 domain-containing protein [Amycolatopsis bartoniae]MBB2934463.1 uncharacterized membrane protein (DUF2068 family) [Amycolatopsis bartoniae]TVT02196.1 DUF2127 domain-containing protein [Amycolatopsis bartoniae]GHF47213.1 hypothetical protein GCM10017566_20440 [Amycolatopsis bartoniae]
MTEPEEQLLAPPGTAGRKRWLTYELLGCARHGHHLIGRDTARIRPEDAMVVRERDGLRWHRCLRCDGWIPLPPPEAPVREYLPEPHEVDVPLRGKLLRDRYVLRLIALDRLLHFVVLAALAVAVFAFAHERQALSDPFFRVMDALQAALGGRSGSSGEGILGEAEKLFNARATTLWLVGAVLVAYAVLEGVEAVGLWLARRWAEYLTFVATAVLLVPEIYELTHKVSVLKILTLLINLAVVVYLLFAKRLFGLRGGGRAEEHERTLDTGWSALERVLPGP